MNEIKINKLKDLQSVKPLVLNRFNTLSVWQSIFVSRTDRMKGRKING